MMNKDEPNEVEVSWEDQKNINRFGRINLRFHELEAEKREKENILNNLEDASNELILCDETEPIMYKMGEAFVSVSTTEVEQLLEKEKEAVSAQVDELNDEMAIIKKEMAELKVKLYSKFGNAINLDE